MIDRKSRNNLAELLRHLANERISVGDFMYSAPWYTPDRGVTAVLTHLIEFYHEIENPQDHLQERLAEHSGGLSTEERREIAKHILFLQSDCEYGYRVRETVWELVRWAAFITIFSSFLFWLMSQVFLKLQFMTLAQWFVNAGMISLCGMGITALLAMTGALVIFIHGLFTREDIRYWPFHKRSDFEGALANPRLLCGNRRH